MATGKSEQRQPDGLARETNKSDFRPEIDVSYWWGDLLHGPVTFRDHLTGLSVAKTSASFSWLEFFSIFIWLTAQSFYRVENQLFQLNCCLVSQCFIFNIYYTLRKAAAQIWSFCGLRAHSFPALMLLCPVRVFISACLNVASPCARSGVSSGVLLFKCQRQRSSEAALCTSGPVWPLLYLADALICFQSQAPKRLSPSRS